MRMLPMSGQPLRSICRLSLFVGAAAAQFIRPATVSAQQLYQLERDDVRIIYTSSLQRYLLPHVVRRFETALAKHSSLIGFKPTERTTLLLSDYRDEGNASATGVPRNYMNFQLSPFRYTYETIPSSERVGFLMSHELVHVAEGDMAAGSDLTFRRLLGGKPYPSAEHPISLLYAYLASPRRFSPKWYNEGLAVFMETWMMGGLGRGLGAYDEMVFRTRILEGRKLYDYVGLESEGTTVDFQVGANAYLYGTRFLSYLASEYGPEQVASWIGRREGTKGYFSREFARIFGKSLSEGWSEWTAFEQSFQEANLAAIRSNPVTEHRDLTSGAVGSVSRAFWDASRGEVYAAVNAPGQVARIVALRIADSRVRSLTEVKGGAIFYVSSVAYDPNSGLLFYTTDNSRLRDIRSVNVDTGESRMLLKNARIGDLAYNPADRSLWGVRHFNGVSTIVRVPYPYEEWDQVTSLRYGLDFYDLDVSPSGEVVTGSLVDINGEQRLVSFVVDSLLAGGSYAKTLFRFGRSNPESFVFTDDGRYLYGSSYYSGVSNVFRYDMQADDMEVLTNAETGYFRPTRISEDSVFAFRYSSNGFVPVALPNRAADRVGAIKFLGQTIVDKFPVVKEWELPASQPLDQESTECLTLGNSMGCRLIPHG